MLIAYISTQGNIHMKEFIFKTSVTSQRKDIDRLLVLHQRNSKATQHGVPFVHMDTGSLQYLMDLGASQPGFSFCNFFLSFLIFIVKSQYQPSRIAKLLSSVVVISS